jgi:serine/threonine protein kinase
VLGKFGKFTLVERIAEGGMAEVFKATVQGPEGFERIVAIKRLHRALCEDADLTQMLVDEARIAVQLHHPNIGNVFDLGCIENQYFIIMEYIDGTDMLRLLEKTRKRNALLPIPASLFLVSETLSGLHYAHTKVGRNGEPLGIVHRDVSPQNVMVTWDGRVKLVDFGIAKARNRAQTTQAGIIKGKFYYMAPEQAHGHHVDPRTDVYAAGMVLYEALVGRSPYDDIPEVELLRHVRQADFPPPRTYRPELDPELSALVEIATQRNPEKRFANAMEFQLALNDYRHRKLGAFAEPHLARTVADVENASGTNDNFRPMERGAYRPSDESLLFDKPDDAALASVSGGGAIDNGNQNPFGDDQPTEIYQRDRHGGQQRDLPPGPHQNRAQGPGASPQQGQGLSSPSSVGVQTRGDLPAHRQSMKGAPQTPRTAENTKPSVVERVAKPKYIYLAIALAVVLVVVVGGIAFFTQGFDQTPAAEGGEPEDSVAAEPTEPAGPTKVSVGFNSKPSNAEVVINDEDHGTTPISVDLDVGKSYRVEFIKDGYQISTQNVLVSESPSDVTAELQEAEGILKILSFPPDADITVEGSPQGPTPLTLTGLETEKTYSIVAKLGDQEMKRAVKWADDQKVQEVMFEFEKVEGERLTLNVPDEKETKKKKRRRPRRRTYRRKRRRRPKPKPKPPAEEEEVDENLDVFGDGNDSSSSEEEDEDLNIWGGSGSSSEKKSPKKKKKKKKKPAKEEDEDLDIW